MPYLSEVVSGRGAYETLRLLAGSSETNLDFSYLRDAMRRIGVEDPEGSIGDFVANGILQRDGDRIRLTSFGLRAAMLLEALNGGDLRDLYRRLGAIDSTLRAYELVREGMTEVFLRNLNDRRGFGRLYLCSPWISLGRREQEMLTHAIIMAERRASPEILVITRPANGEKVPPSLRPLQGLGGTVFLHPRLHTKLYIREPDAGGGYTMAIVGSENLTKSSYLELGIRINNDGQVINQLIRYFWELVSWSQEA